MQNIPIHLIRVTRDRLLSESDWAMMPDAPTDKEAWSAYRQALRDFPASPDHVETVVDEPVAEEPVVELVEGEQP